MSMVKIPTNSPVDLATYDIIQYDSSFKRKNSIVYKGAISNITSDKGDGFLSTTGKRLYVDSSNNIHAGTTTFTPSVEAIVSDTGTYDTSDDILFAIEGDFGLKILHKIDNHSVMLESVAEEKKIKTLSFSNAIDVGGSIDKNGKFVVTVHKENDTNIYIYDDIEEGPTGAYTFYRKSGSNITLYNEGDNYLYVGFDSDDIRKRMVYCITFPSGTLSTKVLGMGTISEEGLITGEPFLWTEIRNTQGDDTWGTDIQSLTSAAGSFKGNPIGGNDYQQYIDTQTYFGISYQDYSEWSVMNDLDNGILQWELFDPTVSTNYIVTQDSYNHASETTVNRSWIDSINTLGKTPEEYPTEDNPSQDNAGNLYKVSLMDFAPGTKQNTGNSQSTYAMRMYVAAIQIDGSRIKPIVFPAIRRSFVGAYANNDGTLSHDCQQLLRRNTEISFIDYDAGIGFPGSKATANLGEQIFPHFRHFMNNTNAKGKSWDYGKGWVRFVYDTIHYVPYDMYGTGIYEEPLKLIQIDHSGTKVSEIDVQYSKNKSDYKSLYTGTSSTRNYPVFSDGAVTESNKKDETVWLSISDNSTIEPGTLNSNLAHVLGYQDIEGTNTNKKYKTDNFRIRLHPVYEAQISANTWYFNHSFGGTGQQSLLSVMPFSYSINDKYSAQVYGSAGATSLAYNKTLLFTPHSMGNSYSINGEYVATWSSGKITWANITATGKVKIEKMTDYIFKTNIIGQKNVLVESRNGNFTFQRAFIPYIMDAILDPYISAEFSMPYDAETITSNDVYYYGFGYNSNLSDKYISSSFLLPAVTIPAYVNVANLNSFNRQVMLNKNGIVRADITKYFYDDEDVEEYWTHSLATTDIQYKNTRYLVQGSVNENYDNDFDSTSWWPDAATTIYPIGILSKTEGENYISSTVDVGDNYASRFYNRNNKTYLVYNQSDAVYFGSEIFTIQSGNYYFDGQGIYYLGSQTDYSQNVFTAYAVGMKFLANSSSEAYFYSSWDKSLYLYTASNTLQKSISFSDMGNIVDSLYASAEQALYILFDDGKLFVKTQEDSCIIEGVAGDRLQSTSVGCQVISDTGYEIYNPYRWDTLEKLTLETEWLGDQDSVTKYKYVDFVVYSDTPETYSFDVEFDTLNGMEIKKETNSVTVNKSDWKNKLFRVRLVPSEIQGNALKIKLSSDNIHLFAISVNAERVSEVTSAPRKARY